MKNNVVDTLENEHWRAEIVYDECCLDPKKEDMLGRIVCTHSRYTLGHSQDVDAELVSMLVLSGFTYEEAYNRVYNSFFSRDEILERIRLGKRVFLLPVFMYEHSEVALSTGGFADPWDSGCLGFVWVSYKDIREEYSCKYVTKAILERVESVLSHEVEYYGHYLNGDCYGYRLYQKQKNPITGHVHEEEVDSCYGFIGDLWEIMKENDMDLPDGLESKYFRH